MGIIKDNRPRDWAYRVAFDRKDLPSLQEMIKHIQETHDVDMIERFNSNCDQFLQGDNPNPEFPTPTNITKTEDLVVNVGLQQCINIILGTSAVRWSNMGISQSDGSVPVSVSDINVHNSAGGPYWLSFATYGWNESKGMKLFFAVLVPQDVPVFTNIINEIGVYNGAVAGPTSTLLNRESFVSNRLLRNRVPDLSIYPATFICSCVIEFCPVA